MITPYENSIYLVINGLSKVGRASVRKGKLLISLQSRVGVKGDKEVPAPPIFAINKISGFSSGFSYYWHCPANFTPNWHTWWWCPCFSVVPEALHEASPGPLKGTMTAQKAIQGSQMKTRELMGGMEKKCFPQQRVTDLPSGQIKVFFTFLVPNYLIACNLPAPVYFILYCCLVRIQMSDN